MTTRKGQGVHRLLWAKDPPKKTKLAERLAQQAEARKRLIERARQIAEGKAKKNAEKS
jgi:hypothetical protein